MTDTNINRILAGDAKVLEEESRWSIEAEYKSGRLDKMPASIKKLVLDIVESCKESK